MQFAIEPLGKRLLDDAVFFRIKEQLLIQREEHFLIPHHMWRLRFLLRLKGLELDLKIPQGHLAMQQQIQG